MAKPKKPKSLASVSEGKPKKRTGKPAGSRHSIAHAKKEAAKAEKKDPRLGSKKPVQLVVSEAPKEKKVTKPKYFSPAKELEAIEADERLDQLLQQQEKGKALSPDENQYLQAKLARHQELCHLLGIADDEPEQEKDIYDKFNDANLDDYR